MTVKLKAVYKSGYFVGEKFFSNAIEAEEYIKGQEFIEHLVNNGFARSSANQVLEVISVRYTIEQRYNWKEPVEKEDSEDQIEQMEVNP